MDTLVQDLRQAFRFLIRRPGLSALAILTMSLGVGASTSMFSILYGVVIRSLPYPHADRIVKVFATEGSSNDRDNWSGANFIDVSAQATSFAAIAGYTRSRLSVNEGGFPVKLSGATVTPAFFQVLGVPPQLGRTLSPTSDRPGGERVVVLAHALWTSRFGADPKVVGRSVELNDEAYTVVGVMPPGFEYPGGTQVWTAARYRCPDPPVPLGDTGPDENRGAQYFQVVARLKDGVSVAQAEHEVEGIGAHLERSYPDVNRGEGITLVPLHEIVVGSVRPALLALFGAGGLLLLLGCANVANLLLAQATRRAHEVAVRIALGAGRTRVARQFLTESAVLGLLGGAGGVLVAFAATRSLVALAALDLPRAGNISVDLPALGFALVTSVLSGLLFGLAPAAWLSRNDPATTLRSAGGRGLAGGFHGRIRGALVVAEIGVCLLLLVGAGLLARTLWMLNSQEPGFTERGTLTARVNVPGGRTLDADTLRVTQSQILQKVRRLPGVDSAAAILSLPIDPGITGNLRFLIEGRSFEEGSEPSAGYQLASDGYFATMGIPVLRGRSFTAADGPHDAPVVVVSKAFADRFFPHEDAIGRHIAWGDPADKDFAWSTIVGIVGNVKLTGLDAGPRVEAYRPMAQAPLPFMTLVLKTKLPPAALADPLRRAVLQVSPSQPVEEIRTMQQILHDSLARRRFTMLMLLVFAGLALTLAAVGLYGVMSFSVAQRSREIGIRMALGATTVRVHGLVFGEAARLLGAGLLAGAAGTLVLGRLLRGLLFNVAPSDPVALAAGALIVTAAVLAAAWVPSQRATRTDPMAALRVE